MLVSVYGEESCLKLSAYRFWHETSVTAVDEEGLGKIPCACIQTTSPESGWNLLGVLTPSTSLAYPLKKHKCHAFPIICHDNNFYSQCCPKLLGRRKKIPLFTQLQKGGMSCRLILLGVDRFPSCLSGLLSTRIIPQVTTRRRLLHGDEKSGQIQGEGNVWDYSPTERSLSPASEGDKCGLAEFCHPSGRIGVKVSGVRGYRKMAQVLI